MQKNPTPLLDSQEETTRPPIGELAPVYIETTVAGDRATGITVVDEKGKGTFFPDETGVKLSDKASSARTNEPLRATAPVHALYPHWEEGKSTAGLAIGSVSLAMKDLEAAAEISEDSNPQFLTLFQLAETDLFRALTQARFNKSFELVVYFCAWALRNAAFSDSRTLSLQGMISVLRELQESPFIQINRATELVTGLEMQGWNGESKVGKLFAQGLATSRRQEQATQSGDQQQLNLSGTQD
jgi:hypothetical protein